MNNLATIEPPASGSIANLITAVNGVMKEIGYVQKAGRNTQQGYAFAGEADLLAAIRPVMVAHGLALMPVKVVERVKSEFKTAKGSDMHRTDIVMRYMLAHTSGEYVFIEAAGDGMDSGDKDVPKAMTIAFKYALRESFAIETGNDPDKESPEETYMNQQERKAKRVAVKEQQASAPPRDREPASEAVKQVAAERTAAAKAAVADASGDTRKDVKLTMTGGGTTYTGDGGEKPCVVFKALHGSKEFTLRHWNPITFGERVAAAGDPENKLTPHKHEGPIIADLTAAPDGNGGYIYTCSNLRIVPAVVEVPAPELGEPISEDELAAMTAKGKK